MKVYVVSICKESYKTNFNKKWEEKQKEIKQAKAGILRIFADKKGAKKYIEDFYNDSATNNATLEQKEKKDGSLYSAKLLDSYKNKEGATWDGIDLDGCMTTVTIVVYQMDVTEGVGEHTLDDDMYDIFAGDETDRAYEM